MLFMWPSDNVIPGSTTTESCSLNQAYTLFDISHSILQVLLKGLAHGATCMCRSSGIDPKALQVDAGLKGGSFGEAFVA